MNKNTKPNMNKMTAIKLPNPAKGTPYMSQTILITAIATNELREITNPTKGISRRGV
jgi:hypothetical protein